MVVPITKNKHKSSSYAAKFKDSIDKTDMEGLTFEDKVALMVIIRNGNGDQVFLQIHFEIMFSITSTPSNKRINNEFKVKVTVTFISSYN